MKTIFPETLRVALIYTSLGILFAAICGCSFSNHSEESHQYITLHSSKFRTIPRGSFKAAAPIQGLFIGVSNYEPQSLQRETPAHTISAALFYELFYRPAYQRFAAASSTTQYGPEFTMKTGDSTFTLMADFRHKPNDPEFDAHSFMYSLAKLDAGGMVEPYKKDWSELDENGGHAYFGKGLPVTKVRIMNAVANQLANPPVPTGNFPAYFIFYISAHGCITTNGESYILPADANSEDHSTWLSLTDLLTPFYQRQTNALQKDALDMQILLFIDVCQTIAGGTYIAKPHDASVPSPPVGVTVVLSASPGEYAYHWTSNEEIEVRVEESRIRGIAVGTSLPKPIPKGIYERAFASRMSVLPIAVHRYFYEMSAVFKSYQEELKEEASSVKETLSDNNDWAVLDYLDYMKDVGERGFYFDPKSESWKVNISMFIENISSKMPGLLQEIDAPSNVKQTVNVFRNSTTLNFPLFELVQPKEQ